MDGILRINGTTGALDTSFSSQPVISSDLGAVVEQDGSTLVSGQTVGDQTPADGSQDFRVIRYFQNGQVDPTYVSPIIQAQGRWMALQSDGKLLISGAPDGQYTNGGTDDSTLIRLNTDGSLDESFTAPSVMWFG